MKEKFLGIKYSTMHFGYWMDYLIVASFAAVFLIGRGFDPVKIGYVTTGAALLAMVLQPIAADIADKSGKISVNKLLILLFGSSFLLALVLVFDKGFIVTFVLFMVVYSFISTVSPLLSALCLKYEDKGYKMNFGIARSCGSFGYAICAYIMGHVTEKMGSESILPVFCGITLILLITLFCMPDTADEHKNTTEDKSVDSINVQRQNEKTASALDFIIKNKRYSMFLLGSMFCFFMNFLFTTYMIYFANAYGGGDSVMGTVLFVTAFSEIPSVAFGMVIMKKISLEWMLRIFSISGVAKYLGLVVISGINGFIAIHIIHFCYTAFYIVASVYYAQKLVSKEDTVKAQAYMGVSTTGITAMLANVIGGYMVKYLPIKTILLIGAAIAAIGTILIFMATGKDTPTHNQKEENNQI